MLKSIYVGYQKQTTEYETNAHDIDSSNVLQPPKPIEEPLALLTSDTVGDIPDYYLMKNDIYDLYDYNPEITLIGNTIFSL